MWNLEYKKMCQANNEKQKSTNDGRNRTSKSRKNQNNRTTGNLQILGILEADTIKHVKIKEKTF